MFQVLLLDNDSTTLSALKREIRSFGIYEVETFSNSSDALARSCVTEFAIAMADYRLKTIDGIYFFELLRQVQPATTRLLISDQNKQEILLDALNRAHAFLFITKPCQREDLEKALLAAVNEHTSHKEIITMRDKIKCQQAVLSWQWQRIKNEKP